MNSISYESLLIVLNDAVGVSAKDSNWIKTKSHDLETSGVLIKEPGPWLRKELRKLGYVELSKWQSFSSSKENRKEFKFVAAIYEPK